MTIDEQALAELCKRHKIKELSLFGSALRDDFGPDSDVDVMIEYDPAASPTLLDMIALRDEMGALLGREVDLVTKNGVQSSSNPFIRDEILNHARVLYAA